MTLVGLLILLLIVAVVFACVPAIDPTMKKIVYAVLAVLFILWICAAFGLIGDFGFYPRERLIVR